MNVAQELGDNELYNYDVLVKLLSDRFDPASRVSAFRSRFHGRSRRHHEDADAFADALTEKDRKFLYRIMSSGIPTKPTGAEARADRRTVRERAVRSGT